MNSILFPPVNKESLSHLEVPNSNIRSISSSTNSSNSASSSSISSLYSFNCNQSELSQPSQSSNHKLNNHIQHEETTTQYLDIGGGPIIGPDSSNQINNNLIRSSNSAVVLAELGKAKSFDSIHSVKMNFNTSSNGASMIQASRGSSDQVYPLPNAVMKVEPTLSNMALNFSHDLSHQMTHQRNLSDLEHNHTSGSTDIKLHAPSTFDSNSIFHNGAVGMSVWKNATGFKHPVTSDHTFLSPSTDLNSFPSWPHGNNFNHQTSSLTNHLLESQHIIGYPPHQRSISDHDLVGCSIKSNQHLAAEQPSPFMLNSSSNPQSSHDSSSTNLHSLTQPLDNHLSHPRPSHLDHHIQGTSYNLSVNDNQLYNGSRSDIRSHHPGASKTTFFMSDRIVQMSLATNHQTTHVTSFQTNDHHLSIHQPTTSHHSAGASAAGSSSGSSKNVGSFKCSTCNEVFSLKTVYQNHVKQHANAKGKYNIVYKIDYKNSSYLSHTD